jgi:hypothetical protein
LRDSKEEEKGIKMCYFILKVCNFWVEIWGWWMFWFWFKVYNRYFNETQVSQYKNLFASKIMSNFKDSN